MIRSLCFLVFLNINIPTASSSAIWEFGSSTTSCGFGSIQNQYELFIGFVRGDYLFGDDIEKLEGITGVRIVLPIFIFIDNNSFSDNLFNQDHDFKRVFSNGPISLNEKLDTWLRLDQTIRLEELKNDIHSEGHSLTWLETSHFQIPLIFEGEGSTVRLALESLALLDPGTSNHVLNILNSLGDPSWTFWSEDGQQFTIDVGITEKELHDFGTCFNRLYLR